MKRFLLGSAILAISFSPVIAPASLVVATPILGNYPNTSLPLSTNATVTPDAAPTNTTRINVSTSTNFKGRLEGYPATGVVRVTDAHPAGSYTVTVKAFDSGGASTTETFTLTVTTPATCIPVRFASANSAAGSGPRSVAVGDFNGDGKQDLTVARYNSNNVSILLGDGAGTFSASTNFAVGSNPFSVAVGDFNGDGKQDLVVANSGSNNVSILLGDGTGNLSAATNFGVGSGAYSVAVDDFNGDGKQDLAVASHSGRLGDGNVSILLGNGAATFSAPATFAVGIFPQSVAVGDFNGDGKQDLGVANSLSNTVSILLGDGAGQFGAATNFDVGSGPYLVTVGDFNGDGKQDLAVLNQFSNNVSILLGDGTGNFGAPTNFAVGSSPLSAAVGDFDGDGKQDLTVANYDDGTVLILLGNGAGGFSAPTNFAVGSAPYSVVVGDFNGDGKQDLAVVNYSSGNVSILLRVCALTPTSAVSRKTHGSAGTFDINLPLTGSLGIECRTSGGTNDYTMIANFSGAVTVTGNPQAQVTSGTGCVGSAGTCSPNGTVTISANTLSIPLTNIGNAQTINVTLNNVSGAIGNVVIPMRVLAGDVNGNAAVNSADVAQTKARLGQTVDATNFCSDVNANGSINGTDVSIIKSNIGTGLP